MVKEWQERASFFRERADRFKQLVFHGFMESPEAVLDGKKEKNERVTLSPLHIYVGMGIKGRVTDLVDQEHVPVDIEDSQGRTPLFYTAKFDEQEIARFLIARGANVNDRDNRGRTALHAAAFFGKTGIAHLLMGQDADINAQALGGSTPLHFSARSGNVFITQYLLERGADPKLLDADGRLFSEIQDQHGKTIMENAQEQAITSAQIEIMAADRTLVEAGIGGHPVLQQALGRGVSIDTLADITRQIRQLVYEYVRDKGVVEQDEIHDLIQEIKQELEIEGIDKNMQPSIEQFVEEMVEIILQEERDTSLEQALIEEERERQGVSIDEQEIEKEGREEELEQEKAEGREREAPDRELAEEQKKAGKEKEDLQPEVGNERERGNILEKEGLRTLTYQGVVSGPETAAGKMASAASRELVAMNEKEFDSIIGGDKSITDAFSKMSGGQDIGKERTGILSPGHAISADALQKKIEGMGGPPTGG